MWQARNKQRGLDVATLIVHTMGTERLLDALSDLYSDNDPQGHAETLGILLGQLALAPRTASAWMEPVRRRIVEEGDVAAVLGVALTALSAGSLFDPKSAMRLARVVSRALQAADVMKEGFDLAFLDLTGPSAVTQGLYGLDRNARLKAVLGSPAGFASSIQATFADGQSAIGTLRDSAALSPTNRTQYGPVAAAAAALAGSPEPEEPQPGQPATVNGVPSSYYGDRCSWARSWELDLVGFSARLQ